MKKVTKIACISYTLGLIFPSRLLVLYIYLIMCPMTCLKCLKFEWFYRLFGNMIDEIIKHV